MMMKRRRAHIDVFGKLFDPQWRCEVLPKPPDGARYPVCLAVGGGDIDQALAARTRQKAIENFLFDEGRHHRNILGIVEKAQQAQSRIQQPRRRCIDGDPH